jgi:hypothetical protein
MSARFAANNYIYTEGGGDLAPLQVGILSADSNIRRLSEVFSEYSDTIRLTNIQFPVPWSDFFWHCPVSMYYHAAE